MEQELNDIIIRIEFMVKDSNSQVGIAIETGRDEAFLIATRDGLLRLAAVLIRSVASISQHKTEINSELLVQWNTTTQGLFDAASEVSISAECIVTEQANVRETLQYFQEHSPM